MKKVWSEMSPRERDALIAEKVMGFTSDDVQGIGDTWNRRNDKTGFYLKPYSTDIAAAWEVIHTIPNSALTTNGNMWFCDSRDVYGTKELACAQTAPEAICLAALRTIGEVL